VDKGKKVLGIATVSDVLGMNDVTPISKVMSDGVFTVPLYSDISTAARIMRNHHIHHVIVTHEQEIVGVLSTYDLLKLVEDHRFVMKNAPTPSKKKAQRQ
jgi:predicted transcriptional regulator